MQKWSERVAGKRDQMAMTDKESIAQMNLKVRACASVAKVWHVGDFVGF